MNKKYINGESLYYAIISGCNEIINKKEYLNKINVFPVPDGDTGTNMGASARHISDNLEYSKAVLDVLKSASDLSIMGARGNSGIILSQFFYGVFKECPSGQESLDTLDIANMMKGSVKYIYGSIENPKEGTILTLIKEWADILKKEVEKETDMKKAFLTSYDKAGVVLKNTENAIEEMTNTKIVDSGAQGFYEFLTGIKKYIVNEEWNKIEEKEATAEELKEEKIFIEHDLENIKYRYCTEAIILPNSKYNKETMKKLLLEFGDSIIVSEYSDRIKLHVHTNDTIELFFKIRNYGTIIHQKVDDMGMQQNVVRNRKSKVAIVTDSSCDLPKELIDELQIHVLPIKIMIGDNVYLEKYTLDAETFNRVIDGTEDVIKTSQPDMFTIQNKYEFLLSYYDSIIVVNLSKGLSGTYNICKLTTERVDDGKITVINSKSLSIKLGMIVEEAAKLANDGATHEEIVTNIRENIENIKEYATLNTIEDLTNGGRMNNVKGKVIKTLVEVLNFKPILSLNEEGKVYLVDKAFSTNSGYKKSVNLFEKKNGKIEKYAVSYVKDIEAAKEYEKIMQDRFKKDAKYIMSVTPCIAIHLGRGAVLAAGK
ncbi:MAG: DegV family EDD domain-containing protein [Clostridia bacterium]|jgi:DegV family protein with EDD domain|nr:DegV family EDD domain-containing protein [Clostridia bacterium]